MGLSASRVKSMTIKFAASPINTQHLGVRADWLAQNQDSVSMLSDMSMK
jgi:hypothetical protein